MRRTMMGSLVGALALSISAPAVQAQTTTPPLASCSNPPGLNDFSFASIINDTGAGQGRTWTYPNVINYLGEDVDVDVEVLSLTGTSDFDSIAVGTSSATTVMQTLSNTGTVFETEAEIQWSFTRSSDGTPIPISTEIEFGDLDIRTSRLETIFVERADYDGYGLAPASTVVVSSDGTTDRFDGGEDDNGLATQAVKFTLKNRTSFTWRQKVERLGTGSSGRAGFSAQGPPFQVDDCPRYDFSDADIAAEARHNAFTQLTLGNAINAENAALTSTDADGDSFDDGVVLPSMTQGRTATINVAVTEENSGDGYLQAWIDWDGNGDFTGTDEQIALDLRDDANGGDATAGDGVINVSVAVPLTATTAQTYARFRWSSEQGLDVSTPAPNGEVEDYILTIAPAQFDYSDASGFADGADYGAAWHTIDGVTFLGTAPTAETEAQTANGDASDDANDDGVSFPQVGGIDVLRLDEGNLISINASVSGVLSAWIDWNQDGDFNDATEQFVTDETIPVGASAIMLTVPVTAPMGATFTRFRFSSAAGLGPTGMAANGEVEDYQVNIARPLPTGLCSNVIRNNGFETPIASTFIQPSETSVEYWGTIPSDPNSGSFARMNAIEIWRSGFLGVPAFEGDQFAEINAHVPGALYQDVLTLTAGAVGWRFAHRARSGNNTIRVLIGPPGAEVEQARFTSDTSKWHVYSGSFNATAGAPITRFKLEAIGGSAAGNFIDAIEFYGACDFGDAPDTYSTELDSGGAYHFADSQNFLGTVFGDAEADATPNGAADGDDTTNLADEDGITLPEIRQGVTSTVVATVNGTGGYLQGWLDLNNNGSFDAGEQIATDLQDGDPLDLDPATGTIAFEVAVPRDAEVSDSYARFRWSTFSGVGVGGVVLNGEVEDYALSIEKGHDYSDAPASYGDALHTVAPGIQLGMLVDVDTGSLSNADATGDNADLLDDEDGVTFGAPNIGATGSITVNATGPGYLNAWIDFDGDGVFSSPVEQIATDMIDSDSDGTITLAVNVPSWATTTETFARFRWSSDFNVAASGVGGDGEVEDYALTLGPLGSGGTILSGTVFRDNGVGGGVAHDGVVNGSETTGQFATISLIETATGTQITTAMVNPDGTWQAVLPDGYASELSVIATPSGGYLSISEAVGTAPVAGNASAVDGTFAFTPVANTTYSGLDFGLIAEPTLTQNQSSSISAGQVVELAHVYTAGSSGLVSFVLVDQVENPAGAFSQIILRDTDCDGVGDRVLSVSIPVSEGEQICLVVRTQASGGISEGAAINYGLTAQTAFSGSVLTHDLRNADRIGGSADNALTLEKLVSNITAGSPESRANSGKPNDVLQYRLILTNPSGEAATNVTVTDATPAYTRLASPVASMVTVAPGMTCSLMTPSSAANVAGYEGSLSWDCPGSFGAGDLGSLTFEVQIY